MTSIIRIATVTTLAGLAAPAAAQVVINELWENVPGDADVFDVALEHIELYGEPGMDLTGYAVALIKGGTDSNNNGVPEAFPEIDEAFSLDGLTLSASGILVIYNDTAGLSDIPFIAPPQANTAGWSALHISPPGVVVDTPGNLGNDNSSTYVLVRRRPGHAIVNNQSVFSLPTYAFHKDINPDVNFDSRLDFGGETPVRFADAARVIEPLQIIDDLAWSNGGGKEYTRSAEQEISETTGFNPDAVSRVAYYGANPMRGLRLNAQGVTVPTRTADEEFIYGEQGPGDGSFVYDTARSGAPTLQGGNGFQDINITGFELTPGSLNDSAGITQFRFVRGDFNFDGAVDAADGSLIAADLGNDLDRTTPCVNDMGQPTGVDCWFYQGRTANALLAMMNMDKTDGPGGGNASFVTQADLDAWNAEFGGPMPCNAADFSAEFGTLDINDILLFASAFNANDAAGDLFMDGVFDINDILNFATAFNAGCP